MNYSKEQPCFLDPLKICPEECRLFKAGVEAFKKSHEDLNMSHDDFADEIRNIFSGLNERRRAKIIANRIWRLEANGASPMECNNYNERMAGI